MTEFLFQMMADLSASESSTVREFFVLKNRTHEPGPGIRFVYFEEEHNDLPGELDRLVQHGQIICVESGDTPLFRMTEELASRLLG